MKVNELLEARSGKWEVQNLKGWTKTFKDIDSPEAIAWMKDATEAPQEIKPGVYVAKSEFRTKLYMGNVKFADGQIVTVTSVGDKFVQFHLGYADFSWTRTKMERTKFLKHFVSMDEYKRGWLNSLGDDNLEEAVDNDPLEAQYNFEASYVDIEASVLILSRTRIEVMEEKDGKVYFRMNDDRFGISPMLVMGEKAFKKCVIRRSEYHRKWLNSLHDDSLEEAAKVYETWYAKKTYRGLTKDGRMLRLAVGHPVWIIWVRDGKIKFCWNRNVLANTIVDEKEFYEYFEDEAARGRRFIQGLHDDDELSEALKPDENVTMVTRIKRVLNTISEKHKHMVGKLAIQSPTSTTVEILMGEPSNFTKQQKHDLLLSLVDDDDEKDDVRELINQGMPGKIAYRKKVFKEIIEAVKIFNPVSAALSVTRKVGSYDVAFVGSKKHFVPLENLKLDSIIWNDGRIKLTLKFTPEQVAVKSEFTWNRKEETKRLRKIIAEMPEFMEKYAFTWEDSLNMDIMVNDRYFKKLVKKHPELTAKYDDRIKKYMADIEKYTAENDKNLSYVELHLEEAKRRGPKPDATPALLKLMRDEIRTDMKKIIDKLQPTTPALLKFEFEPQYDNVIGSTIGKIRISQSMKKGA